ncbi:MAG: hypothetical protein ACK5NG_07365 [Chthoniobacterales bacterium]
MKKSFTPSLRWLICHLFLLYFLSSETSLSAPIVREAGAIYLSDFGDRKLKRPLKKATMCYFDANLTRYGGTLRYPQEVEILAIRENIARIRGRAQQGQVAAWIRLDDIADLPENFVANLEKAEQRRIVVSQLIKNNEVALGMTPDEVSMSLGKPQKITKRASNKATEQVWEFIRYKTIPQQRTGYDAFGQLVSQTFFVKVPDGTLTVSFQNGIVSSLDQSEGNIQSGNQATVVVPPLFVY